MISSGHEARRTTSGGGPCGVQPGLHRKMRASPATYHPRLELAEVQKALKHMVKPGADGEQATPVVAFPPEFTTESGEVHLPISWFWATFSSMD